MGNKVKLSPEEMLSYYEDEAKKVRMFGSLREISLVENILGSIPKRTRRVMDIGCGEGYLLHSIHKKYPSAEIYGSDISKGRVMATEKNVPKAVVVRADASNLPFPKNFFDVVVCSEVIEHIPGYKKAVDEILRVASDVAIITVPNEQPVTTISCPKCRTTHYLDGHVNSFDEKKIRGLFSRKNVKVIRIRKFSTIYSYNGATLKLPFFLRLSFDRLFAFLSRYISFLKPNFLMVVVRKSQRKEGE